MPAGAVTAEDGVWDAAELSTPVSGSAGGFASEVPVGAEVDVPSDVVFWCGVLTDDCVDWVGADDETLDVTEEVDWLDADTCDAVLEVSVFSPIIVP